MLSGELFKILAGKATSCWLFEKLILLSLLILFVVSVTTVCELMVSALLRDFVPRLMSILFDCTNTRDRCDFPLVG